MNTNTGQSEEVLERLSEILTGIEDEFRGTTARIEGALASARALLAPADGNPVADGEEVAPFPTQGIVEGLDAESRALIDQEASRGEPFVAPVNELDSAPLVPDDHYVDRPFTDPMDCFTVQDSVDAESVEYIEMDGSLPLEPGTQESEPLFGGTLDIYVDEMLKHDKGGELHQSYGEDGSYESTYSPFQIDEEADEADAWKREDGGDSQPRFQI